MTTRGRAKPARKTGNTRPVVVGGICTPSAAARVGATSCCTARSRVRSRSHCGARKHQRNRYVIRPRRTVHVGDVSPRDEVAFARHDQELAGSSREVCPSKHFQETLSRRKGGCIGWCCTRDPRCLAPNRSFDLLARYRPSHRDQRQGDSDPRSYFAHASTLG
jgi:hypothetical protein